MLQQFLALGYGPLRVDLGVANDALAVEDVGRALVHAALVVEDAVGLADRAVRPEVRQQGEGHAAQFFGPTLETGRGVDTELQNLAVQLLEFFVVRTEPVDLVRSPTGKRERHERDHDRPPAQAGERDFLISMRR